MPRIVRLVAAVAALSLSGHALQAQCVSVPFSGCPGATTPACGGSTALGTTLTVSCTNSGRGNPQALFIGGCLPAALPISPPITCVNTCGLGVSLSGLVVIDPQMQPVSIPIPNLPTLVGVPVCMQCVDANLTGACILLSEAVSATITT